MGNRIQELRDARGWTQADLAERMGTSQQQVGRLEKEQRRLHKDWLDKLADALEVRIEELLEAPDRAAEMPELMPVDDGAMGSVAQALGKRGLRIYRVEADSVIDSQLPVGAIVTVDETPEGIGAAKTGDIVSVEAGLGEKRTLLRVLIRPCLVTTNRPERNHLFRLDNPAMAAKITGVVLRD